MPLVLSTPLQTSLQMSMSDAPLPPTRWALGGSKTSGYGERFAELIADGADVVGEARLADTLVERGATILDADE